MVQIESPLRPLADGKLMSLHRQRSYRHIDARYPLHCMLLETARCAKKHISQVVKPIRCAPLVSPSSLTQESTGEDSDLPAACLTMRYCFIGRRHFSSVVVFLLVSLFLITSNVIYGHRRAKVVDTNSSLTKIDVANKN